MDKRYQVFISSTYSDLQNERQKVIQTIMEMDCIPSGMELFPAADEDQFEFIKKVIDDCDYYILIIAARYGSVGEDGISYTEKEYDYAVEKGIRVIVLIHSDLDSIPFSKTDKNDSQYQKLLKFIEKVKPGRLVKFWKNAEELPGIVSLSLSKTIKMYPAIGWVRSNLVGSSELLNEINDLRKENNLLKEKIDSKPNEEIDKNEHPQILDESITVFGTFRYSKTSDKKNWEITLTWNELFAIISPYLLEFPHDHSVKELIKNNLTKRTSYNIYSSDIDDQIFQTIKIQFSSLGLIEVKYLKTTNNSMGLFWSLTKQGNKLMYDLRTIKNV